MSAIKLLLIFFTILSVVYGDLYQFKPSKSTNSKYPDHCYDSEANAYYRPRAEFYDRVGKCQKIFCYADFSMTAMGCGKAAVVNCKELPMELSKPYPECCPKFQCADGIVTPPYA